jgi:hypothetical protein
LSIAAVTSEDAKAEAKLAARRMLNSAVLEVLDELGEGGADAIGVREPRRPLPTAGASEVQMELDR